MKHYLNNPLQQAAFRRVAIEMLLTNKGRTSPPGQTFALYSNGRPNMINAACAQELHDSDQSSDKVTFTAFLQKLYDLDTS